MAGTYRKRRGKRAFFALTTVLLMLLALLIGICAFFSVSEIRVTGTYVYTPEQIIEASGLETGDNLLFINDSQVAARIRGAYNYVSQVKIVRVLPNVLELEITESYPLAYTEADGKYWLIDENCRLLETVDKSKTEGNILIIGLKLNDPVQGTTASTAGDQMRITCLTELLTALKQYEMQDEILSVDISNIGNVTMQYGNLYTVQLGRGTGLDSKISLLKELLPKLDGTTPGIVDFSSENEAHFIPD